MAARQFVNFSNVSGGGSSLRSVQSITVTEDGDDVEASGDDDTVLTGLFMALTRVVTTIALNDLGHGVQRGNGVDAVNFTALAQSPNVGNVAYTIVNGKVSSRADSPVHGANAASVLTIKHYSNDGSTSPLSIS